MPLDSHGTNLQLHVPNGGQVGSSFVPNAESTNTVNTPNSSHSTTGIHRRVPMIGELHSGSMTSSTAQHSWAQPFHVAPLLDRIGPQLSP